MSAGDHSAFIAALEKEAEIRKSYITSEPFRTLYIGGGTPTVLSQEEIARILTFIDNHLGLGETDEITIEVNPDDVTGSYMKDLKSIGINRVSIGIQSWNDDDLKMLNRRHTAAQGKEAISRIFSSGFENVSADLIYGIPGMESDRWAENLDITFSTGINHLSAYHLSIEPGTVFWKMKEKGLLHEVEEEESIQQFNVLVDKTEEAGFIHYEISNFGKPGFFSVHNTNYWKQVPYIGLGPSAHSFNGYSRQWNLSDVEKYIRLVRGEKEFYIREELDLRTRFNEYVLTSLRTMWGIDLDYVEKTFEKEGYDYIMNTAGKYIDYGLMRKENNTLILSNQGKMISDNIISEFMMPSREG